jgi:hypothetical protein
MNLVPGTYAARAIEADLGETSKGDPQVAVLLQVVDEAFAGETITWFGSFTDKAKPFTFAALRTLGWSSDDVSDLTGVTDNEVKVVLEEDTYDGKTRLRVKWINRLGGLALKTPMSADRKKAFAAQMRGDAILSRQSAGQAPQARPAPRNAVPPKYGPSGAGASLKHTGTPEESPESIAAGMEDLPF